MNYEKDFLIGIGCFVSMGIWDRGLYRGKTCIEIDIFQLDCASFASRQGDGQVDRDGARADQGQGKS
jgi:hypothetical protein